LLRRPCLPRRSPHCQIDGATHSSKEELAHDQAREAILRARGDRIVRFANAEVYEQADRVFDAILVAPGHGTA